MLLPYTNYNLWANDLLFNLIERELSEELLDKEIVSSFSSLRKTVYHIWDAEYIWIKRINGESFTEGPGKDLTQKFSIARNGIQVIDKAFIGLVKNSSEADINKSFSYKNVEGKAFSNPMWQSIHHCMNHSNYHRGQVVTMMRQLGLKEIPSTDFITYCRIVN